MLSIILLSVGMLSVGMLSVGMLSVAMLCVVMLNVIVIMPSVLAPLGWPNIKLYLLTELDYMSKCCKVAKASTATVAVTMLV